VADDPAFQFGHEGEVEDEAGRSTESIDQVCFLRPAERRLVDRADGGFVVGGLGADSGCHGFGNPGCPPDRQRYHRLTGQW
jgi:hypothetical protein